MTGIFKVFGETVANNSVDFDLRPGEIHVLLGENGAGKTTLMNILFGHMRADAGTILVDGQAVDIQSPSDAIAHGIGMVHQHFCLVPSFTVAENVMLGVRKASNPVLRDHEIEEAVADRGERVAHAHQCLARRSKCSPSTSSRGWRSSKPCTAAPRS